MTVALQLSLLAPRWETIDERKAAGRFPFVDPFRAFHAETLRKAGPRKLVFDEASWDATRRDAVGCDVECFSNAFVVCFERFETGQRLAFELSSRSEIDRAALFEVLRRNLIVTFNGIAYDLPMIAFALSLDGLAVDRLARLKEASDRIVAGEHRPWEIERELGVRAPKLNHVDLMEVNPSVRTGLKSLHGRLHARFLVDLPFDPAARLTPEEINFATLYCFNDLDATKLLYRACRPALELRVALAARYGTGDLRSKSDSQVGEIIVRRRVEAALGARVERPRVGATAFRYEPPSWLRFESPGLRSLLAAVVGATFHVGVAGRVAEPDAVKDRLIRIGATTYSFGIGGLHSTEAHRLLRSDAERVLIDADLASHYPTIIANLGLYPAAMGPRFLEVYGALRAERLAAKREGDRVKSEGLKIAINGCFGKLLSPFSPLYAPHLGIAVTLTGQLMILQLIERAEAAGVPVASANTDGLVFFCPRSREAELERLVSAWEAETGFEVERTRYAALASSSVNTYVAIKEDGKVKRRGPLADPWSDGDAREQMKKNPQMTILSEAVVAHLRDGTPLERTIRAARDPRGFLTITKVASGATWRGHALGRVARFYWSVDGEPIRTAGGGRVARTEGARPLIELTDEPPADVDYLRYCEEAARLLAELGA